MIPVSAVLTAEGRGTRPKAERTVQELLYQTSCERVAPIVGGGVDRAGKDLGTFLERSSIILVVELVDCMNGERDEARLQNLGLNGKKNRLTYYLKEKGGRDVKSGLFLNTVKLR